MAKPQLIVDGNSLDNGTWRRIIGGPSKLMDPNGEQESFAIEFLIKGDTAAETASRITSTEADFARQGARFQFFPDSSSTTTLIDWSPFDSVHPFVASAVELAEDQPQSVYCAHCRFILVAQRYPRAGTGGGSSTLPFTGQSAEFKIAESYTDEGYKTIAVSGHFHSVDTAGGGGTFTLTDVGNNGGYARFTLVGTLPAFQANSRIVVTGTTGYNGTHYITGISGQNVTTRTLYASSESGLSGSGVISVYTSGESLYNTARATILTDYLGTTNVGAPSASVKRYLSVEQLVKRDADGADVDFLLVSTDEPFVPTSMAEGGVNATRGFEFDLTESRPQSWFPECGTLPRLYNATGTFTIHRDQMASTSLYDYYLLAKAEMEAKVVAEMPSAGTLKLLTSAVTLNYNNNGVRFSFLFRTNWTGTMSYSRTRSDATVLDMASWSDSKGFDKAQRPNRAPSKVVVITTDREGEGEVDLSTFGSATTPVESGFTFIEQERQQTVTGPYSTEFSNNMFQQRLVQTWHRYKFEGGAVGSANIEQVNPSVAGGGGGGGSGGAAGVKSGGNDSWTYGGGGHTRQF